MMEKRGAVKNRIWITVVATLAVVSLLLTVLLWVVPRRNSTIVKVYVDGACVYSVDLSKVQEPYEYRVETPYGVNTLAVEAGRIRVIDADCKGTDCVRQGWLEKAGKPIVCAPHHLVVQIEGRTDDNSVIQ